MPRLWLVRTMICKALIASHTANGFAGQNAAIVTQFKTEIIRQTAWKWPYI